ncbi:hypothetical protein [Salidesulfovibrio brasiliensis]|uniref:hypothetical protein n=1 Tax=Salidesulfovibrio brasiliensis TaxID=221711 RepID=UPI0006D28594|nr:hypothetical protein [Salidesulfovibrio brasiliensis]
MKYRCINCDWTGQWDSLIHETMCPVCRSTALPLQQPDPFEAERGDMPPHLAARSSGDSPYDRSA